MIATAKPLYKNSDHYMWQLLNIPARAPYDISSPFSGTHEEGLFDLTVKQKKKGIEKLEII